MEVTTCLDGFHGDTSATFLIGEVSAEARHVVDVARRCRDAGIAEVRHGARLGDIGAAIDELARKEGCSVVEEFGGHGIGHQMHAPPLVAHTGTRGTGIKLRSGMVITIEPMVNLGRPGIRLLPDGWTVVTEDGSLSAEFSHTILVTHEGCEVLTARELPLSIPVPPAPRLAAEPGALYAHSKAGQGTLMALCAPRPRWSPLPCLQGLCPGHGNSWAEVVRGYARGASGARRAGRRPSLPWFSGVPTLQRRSQEGGQ